MATRTLRRFTVRQYERMADAGMRAKYDRVELVAAWVKPPVTVQGRVPPILAAQDPMRPDVASEARFGLAAPRCALPGSHCPLPIVEVHAPRSVVPGPRPGDLVGRRGGPGGGRGLQMHGRAAASAPHSPAHDILLG